MENHSMFGFLVIHQDAQSSGVKAFIFILSFHTNLFSTQVSREQNRQKNLQIFSFVSDCSSLHKHARRSTVILSRCGNEVLYTMKPFKIQQCVFLSLLLFYFSYFLFVIKILEQRDLCRQSRNIWEFLSLLLLSWLFFFS